jgi:hypothetical protein
MLSMACSPPPPPASETAPDALPKHKLTIKTLRDLFLFSSNLLIEMQDINITSICRLSIKCCNSLATLCTVMAFSPTMTHLSIYKSIFNWLKSRWSKAFQSLI